MQLVIFVLAGLVGAGDYARPLGSAQLDQATLDAEGYGEKKGLTREEAGLRITLPPGSPETGWKAPPALRIGGDFTITADVSIAKLPKPAQEDGVGIGLAIATQNADQPEATLVRLLEPSGADVYRPVSRAQNDPMAQQQQQMMMMRMQGMVQPGAKPPKAPRPTFPAKGEAVRLELRRKGPTVRYFAVDATSEEPRYLGQVSIGPGDVSAVKLFATNRNGAESVEVLLRGLTIRADRLTGLGTAVSTLAGEVVYGEPTGIEGGTLLVGGPAAAGSPGGAPTPAQVAPTSPGTMSDAVGMVRMRAMVMAAPGGVVQVVAAAPAAAVAVAAPPVAPPQNVAPPQGPSGPPPTAAAPSGVGELPEAIFEGAAALSDKPKPKARIGLDELDAIRFERPAPAFAARFLGQPNVDLTGRRPEAPKEAEKKTEKPKVDDVTAPPPGTVAAVAEKIAKVEPEQNGIRDLQLWLSNLNASEIKQVTVTCATDKGQGSWRLDTTDTRDWPLVLRRSGAEGWADLFLDPPDGDCHEKEFTINVTYADGQSGSVNAKADAHTDAKLAIDAAQPAAPLFDARVELVGDDRLYGKLRGIEGESLKLTTAWNELLEVPLSRVAGVQLSLPDRTETPESFARRLKERGAEDVLLARAKEGEVVAIAGVVEGTEGDKLRFRYGGKSRTLPLRLVEGLVLAARPAPDAPEGTVGSFSMPGGVVVTGRWTGLDATTWKVETAWGQALRLPAGEVRGVRFRGGRVVSLSDLEPSRVEETPFFGGRLPWRRDVNLRGEPLKMGGRTYERGVAVHSRSALTYDLDGRFDTFESLVGFDDAAKGKGRVDCRVFADGREIFANADLRGDAAPVALKLPVAGVRRLKLLVDFGADQDTGDRVIWADARLRRTGEAGDDATD